MIAREAHITPSLLQKYYPEKEAILEAFVEHAVGEIDIFTTAVHKTIATTSDARSMLRMIGLRYVDFVDRMRGFYLTWIMNPETIKPYNEALPDFITLNHRILAAALARRTVLDEGTAIARVLVFFSSLFAWVIYYSRVGASIPESAEQRVDRLVEMLTEDAGQTTAALIGS